MMYERPKEKRVWYQDYLDLLQSIYYSRRFEFENQVAIHLPCFPEANGFSSIFHAQSIWDRVPTIAVLDRIVRLSPANSTNLLVTLESWNGTIVSPVGTNGILIFEYSSPRNAFRNRELPKSRYSTKKYGPIAILHYEKPSRVYI